MTDWPCKDKIFYEAPEGVVYCADCRDILPYLPKVDLCLTDPPYGLKQNAFRVANRGKLAKTTNYGDFAWDTLVDIQLIQQSIQSSNNAIIFGGNYYDLSPKVCWLIWDKDNSGDFADCEMAWTNLPGSIRRIIWRWNGMLQENMSNKEKRVHPTQKPLPVIEWCINQADIKTNTKQQIILDPFMGSGTTCVAAKKLNRKFIGIEISEKYCQIAVDRLRQSVMDLNCESTNKIEQVSLL